ncbi:MULTISPECIES: hypothetical protein [Streptomyces]|uniref:hypothetical protein n=1 Tax=Streptomyces TaxID=1883 RepID=UPI002248BE49|nr:hypothetical protein [Streptomyces sp. JHD 1]MCX2968781.1 hypothetical protein [Streptomyces sp. JHD 1]
MDPEASKKDPAQAAEDRVNQIFTSAFGGSGAPDEIVAEFVRKTIEGDPKFSFAGSDHVVGDAFDNAAAFMNSEGQNESVNAASQALYYSTQAVKFDASFATIAADVIKLDETGLSIAGARVFDMPWIGSLERATGYTGRQERREDAPVQAREFREEMARINTRLSNASRVLSPENAPPRAPAITRTGRVQSELRSLRSQVTSLARALA